MGMEKIKITPIEQAIIAMGGVAEVVRKLNLNGHATVFQWKKTRVPAERCPQIEQATGGLVRCEDLRPDVAWSVIETRHLRNPAPTAQAQPATQSVAQGV